MILFFRGAHKSPYKIRRKILRLHWSKAYEDFRVNMLVSIYSFCCCSVETSYSSMKKYSNNCSDRKIFTTVYFGIENCTGRSADFQKLFKGRWRWLRYLRGVEAFEAPAKRAFSLHTLLQGSLCQGSFPSEARGGRFQADAAETSPGDPNIAQFGIATCAEPGLTGMPTLSAKLFIWDMCSSHAIVFLPGFVSKHRWEVLCVCVCAQLCISKKFASLSLLFLGLLQGGFTWVNWRSHIVLKINI